MIKRKVFCGYFKEIEGNIVHTFSFPQKYEDVLLVNLESYFKYKDTFKFPLLFYNKKDYFNILVALSGSKICWSKIAKPL